MATRVCLKCGWTLGYYWTPRKPRYAQCRTCNTVQPTRFLPAIIWYLRGMPRIKEACE